MADIFICSMIKNVRGFLDNLLEFFLFFLNIIVNANFFSDLKFECYCENYPEIVLKEKITGP